MAKDGDGAIYRAGRQRPFIEGEADGVDSPDRSSACGFDDRPDVCVEDSPPCAAETVGDLAVDRAGAQRPLRAVVGRREIPVLDEDEEMTADLPDDRLQLAAGRVARDQGHEAVEPTVKVGLVALERCVGEAIAPPPDGAGAFEQALQARREDGVARVDGVLHVADQMRETDLMLASGPAHLAAIAVGDPVIRAVIAKEGFHHRLGAVLVGDEDGAVGVMEHPQPPVRLADPEAGLVRGQRRAAKSRALIRHVCAEKALRSHRGC